MQKLTNHELIRLAEILTKAGQISNPSCHEFLLMSDVMGLTMIVDYNTNEKPDGAFESSVLGLFYRSFLPIAADIAWRAESPINATGASENRRHSFHAAVISLIDNPQMLRSDRHNVRSTPCSGD